MYGRYDIGLRMTMSQAIKQIIIDAVKLWLALLRIMVPIIIAVKIATELGLIKYLAIPLAPVMKLVGLPAATGLVWATAIFNSIYAAMVVYVSLLSDMPALSVAQITVLGLMVLVAHGLPVEAKIVQKCGVSFWGQFFFRLTAGFGFGLIAHLVFSGFNLLQEPSALLWTAKTADPSLWAWAKGEVRNLLMILVIINLMMALMRLLNYFKITDVLIRLLRPILKILGIGQEAATITIIGLTMGIAFGGGLILHEIKSGRITKDDVFASVTFMGLSHGIIEDTLLLLLLGASSYGVFWGRLLLSLLVMAVLTRLIAVRFFGLGVWWKQRFSKG